MQPFTVVAEKGTMESNLFTPGTEKSTTPNAAYIMMILNTFVHNVEPERNGPQKRRTRDNINWRCI